MKNLIPLKFIALVDWRDFLAIVQRRKNYIILPENDSSVVCSMLDISIVEIDEDKKPTGDYVDGLVSWVEFVGDSRIVSFEVRKISIDNDRPDCPNYHGFPYDKNDHTD